MTPVKSVKSRRTALVKALSLLLAALLWLSVIVERPGETKLIVPVRLEHLSAGLTVASPPPGEVEVTVSGPRILLWLLPFRDVKCRIDLAAASPGTASVAVDSGCVNVPDRELKVVRVFPASLVVTTVSTSGSLPPTRKAP